jgi:ribokinase
MSRVVVIGSANVDLTVRVDRLPRVGETVSGGEFYTSFGGKGANQAVAALRAGAQVQFVAKVGSDPHGEAMLRNLSGMGVPIESILRDPHAHSGVALIVVERAGKNLIAVAPGSNRNLTEEDVRAAEAVMAWGQLLLIQLEIPLAAVREALRLAKSHGLLTILNPAPARALSRELLALCDFLTPNEVEVGALTRRKPKALSEICDAAESLRHMGAKQVIVTLGDRGALLVGEGRVKHFPAVAVQALDSTAAGDAFNGALACALAEGKVLEEAMTFANAAGALAVTRRGAQDSLPTREEIERLLKGCNASFTGG